MASHDKQLSVDHDGLDAMNVGSIKTDANSERGGGGSYAAPTVERYARRGFALAHLPNVPWSIKYYWSWRGCENLHIYLWW